jgi:hypothetical protein
MYNEMTFGNIKITIFYIAETAVFGMLSICIDKNRRRKTLKENV